MSVRGPKAKSGAALKWSADQGEAEVIGQPAKWGF
jgi:hypothetical protein